MKRVLLIPILIFLFSSFCLSLSPLTTEQKCSLIKNSFQESFSSYGFSEPSSQQKPVVYLAPYLDQRFIDLLSSSSSSSSSSHTHSFAHSTFHSSSQQHYSVLNLSPNAQNPISKQLTNLISKEKNLSSHTITSKRNKKLKYPTQKEREFISKFDLFVKKNDLFGFDFVVGSLSGILAPFFFWLNQNVRVIVNNFYDDFSSSSSSSSSLDSGFFSDEFFANYSSSFSSSSSSHRSSFVERHKREIEEIWRKELASYLLISGFEPEVNQKTLPYMLWQSHAVAKSLILCLFPPQSICELHFEKKKWCLTCGEERSSPHPFLTSSSSSSSSSSSLSSSSLSSLVSSALFNKPKFNPPKCSLIPQPTTDVCRWVKNSWEEIMSSFFSANEAEKNLIVVGSEGTTGTRYLTGLGRSLGLQTQHWKSGISSEDYWTMFNNSFSEHQSVLGVLDVLEKRELLADSPIPIWAPMLLYRNPNAKLILSWRPFNGWILSRMKSHTYMPPTNRLNGTRYRVDPEHPRPLSWPYYAGNTLMLSCLRDEGVRVVRLFEKDVVERNLEVDLGGFMVGEEYERRKKEGKRKKEKKDKEEEEEEEQE